MESIYINVHKANGEKEITGIIGRRRRRKKGTFRMRYLLSVLNKLLLMFYCIHDQLIILMKSYVFANGYISINDCHTISQRFVQSKLKRKTQTHIHAHAHAHTHTQTHLITQGFGTTQTNY